MNSAESKFIPAPPNLIRALLAGFDTIANHIELILFAIVLDALLWLGPQVKIFQIVKSYLDWTMGIATQQSSQLANVMQSGQTALIAWAESFNLFSVLSAFSFGIPSLMAERKPAANPFGNPLALETPSVGWAMILFLSFLLVGILFGTLYFSLVSQATMQGHVDFWAAVRTWIKKFMQVLLLTLFYLVLMLCISIPISCALPFILIGGPGAGQIVLFVYGVLILWLLFPLVLSPFGIFIHQDQMWVSVMRGVRITRFTMTTTVLFILVAVLLWQGLDMLWSTPADSSWFALVGILGHAFIMAGLLAATFIYYRDAGVYVEQRVQQLKG